MTPPFEVNRDFVEVVEIESDRLLVEMVLGDAWRVEGESLSSLHIGCPIELGDVLVVAGGASVRADSFTFLGKKRGRTYSFAKKGSVLRSPNRGDAPKLLLELERLEKRRDRGGVPVVRRFEEKGSRRLRALAAEFAFANLDRSAAVQLAWPVARRVRSVLLFFSGDVAFVAMAEVSIAALRILIETLECPVNPHLVPEDVLERLMIAVYPEEGSAR